MAGYMGVGRRRLTNQLLVSPLSDITFSQWQAIWGVGRPRLTNQLLVSPLSDIPVNQWIGFHSEEGRAFLPLPPPAPPATAD